MDILGRSGLVVDDVVSEDQPLYWTFKNRVAMGPVLVFDRTSERTLILALKENAILLSKTYPAEESVKNILSEVSFLLLESGLKPARAIVTGTITEEDIAGILEIPVETYQTENLGGAPLPAALVGAKRWGTCAPISLLPNAQKIRTRILKRRQMLKETAAVFVLFLVCVSLALFSHLFFFEDQEEHS